MCLGGQGHNPGDSEAFRRKLGPPNCSAELLGFLRRIGGVVAHTVDGLRLVAVIAGSSQAGELALYHLNSQTDFGPTPEKAHSMRDCPILLSFLTPWKKRPPSIASTHAQCWIGQCPKNLYAFFWPAVLLFSAVAFLVDVLKPRPLANRLQASSPYLPGCIIWTSWSSPRSAMDGDHTAVQGF